MAGESGMIPEECYIMEATVEKNALSGVWLAVLNGPERSSMRTVVSIRVSGEIGSE